MEVKAWKEIVNIPTYGIGKPEKNPVFLEKRVYQGSSGIVYPYPVVEKIYDEKVDKAWNAVFLENRYLKIMILPEIGGRVQMAYDKIKQRHFIYYNRVIKPALVGLTGPWISGGIEFNWPQHHRPGTYEPVDCIIEENEDGSKTVWCSEVERLFRTKGMTGFTLYRDKAYLEIKVRLFNRTPHPQTFLWWANPAVKVNDEYQSVFPPDVYAVFDHGKRDVSTFPIATGTYYKVDYSAGVDISRYKNIPVPTSYMAVASKYDFVGGYEHDSRGGMLHVANHHIAPGKKQWTWGNGEFGKAWDRNLTDEDGPYIELMCGVFTDNQPDFSWIMPYEERAFSQYFMPYRELGMVKNATRDAMVNMEFEGNVVLVKVYCTGVYDGAKIILAFKGRNIMEEQSDLSPETIFEKAIPLPLESVSQDFRLLVVSKEGKVLVSWQPGGKVLSPVPEPAKPAKEPGDIKSVEQLYLTGLHLEQYRHATFKAGDYYMEALGREPGDVRCNNAMGLLLMRRGCFTEAESFFREAINTLTERNPNPYEGEPFYNLGLCLRFMGRNEEAYDAFNKCVWNAAWQDPGYFNLARLACIQGEMEDALNLVSSALVRNWQNHLARHLKAVILRKSGRIKEAVEIIEDSVQKDRFNYGLLFEKYLLSNEINKAAALKEVKVLMQDNIHTCIEYSLDYALAGFFDEAASFLQLTGGPNNKNYPMKYYLLGWYALQQGDIPAAEEFYKVAATMNPEFCFPNRLEELLALQSALNLNPEDAKGFYYLGNFWYANRNYEEAIRCWERAKEIDNSFPGTRRNLSLAYYNKKMNAGKALEEMETAFSLDTSDYRILMELDQLYKRLNKSVDKRLDLLLQYPGAWEYRDDLCLEVISLYNLKGDHDTALDLLEKRQFHPWEGGEGKVSGQYVHSLTEIARKAIASGDYNKALDYLERTGIFPNNLGEGKLPGTQENDILYWKGCAYEGLGDQRNAVACWQKASVGLSEPSSVVFYNDQPPDKIFYQGLALLKLGKKDDAFSRFNKLRDYGEQHIADTVKTDYFAVSLPDMLIWEDDLRKRNTLHCKYLIGLGSLGMGNRKKAHKIFTGILNDDLYHIGCRVHLDM